MKGEGSGKEWRLGGGRVGEESPAVQDVGNKFSLGAPDRHACSSGGQLHAHSKGTWLENLFGKMEATATGFQEAGIVAGPHGVRKAG